MPAGRHRRARAVALAAVVVVLASARPAHAELDDALIDVTAEIDADLEAMPTRHILLRTGAGTLRGPNGRLYLIPQGSHVLNPNAWAENDADFLRLQESETRLAAENKSLRQSAGAWRPSWLVVMAIGLTAGFAGGMYVHSKL